MHASFADELARARTAFDAWRASQPGRRPLPDHLWTAAVALLERYSLTVVARELRLNPTQLRQRQREVARAHVARSAQQPHFLQVQAADLALEATSAADATSILRLVVERADGSRLTPALPPSEWTRLLALYTAFLGR